MKNQIKQHPISEGGYTGPEITEVTKVTKVKKRNTMSIVLLITTFLFLGTSIYLLSDNIERGKFSDNLTTKVIESESRYTDLDTKYTATLAELESYKGRNAELDSMLTVQENYVIGLKANLNKERKNRQMSDADYKKHLAELDGVIAALNAKLETAQRENIVLTTQRDSLGADIGMKQTAITGLQTENTGLTKKVTIASLLVPVDVELVGSRFKTSGKELVTYKAEKAEQIRLCFNVPVDNVAEAGKKVFLIRILSPGGTVLSVPEQGSGVFTSAVKQEEVQFTTSVTVDYNNLEKGVCVHWTQKTPYASGQYTSEIYQEGYLVGKSTFVMK